ncbi:substrate-binding domain-containing protein [Oceanibacterium hippocampi]|uniref:Aliphatic amidase expression-regulating protein n=1 Tax=Oceanibacterium hippocampi TaxID=745714 RepID=A0A1Y5TCM1_9PROT|nr:substrate-binding domain-containing protein [Oceanibacterium hippocampi]SLN60928.1 Aliphatic amidase expression-regulating protein [Oceanibacterium hippocampi]
MGFTEGDDPHIADSRPGWQESRLRQARPRSRGDDWIGQEDRYRIGLFVPMSGAAGLWGASCVASAQLAAHEINARGGIAAREVEFVLVDASDETGLAVEHGANDLIEDNAISAIVGMHLSSVRQRLNKIVGARVPYVYTPLYEGNERTPGVFAIGETPEDQLRPAIRHLSATRKVRRWALIGNDYVWPRASNAFARDYIDENDGEVVFECYVPFGFPEIERLVEHVATCGADAVLISLIGQDAVEFNRLFGAAGLDRRAIRLSAAIEESGLLAMGAENTKRLFAVSSYFGGLRTDRNIAFKERYFACHGEYAPVLNALGQSLYEGVNFLAAAVAQAGPGMALAPNQPLEYVSARQGRYWDNQKKALPIYLARADGHLFATPERIF